METATKKRIRTRPNVNTGWSIDVYVGNRLIMSTGEMHLEDAIKEAVKNAVYYQACYPNEKISYALEENCQTCMGLGEIAKPRLYPRQMKTCPACKGKPVMSKIAPVYFEMPDSANRIKLTQE